MQCVVATHRRDISVEPPGGRDADAQPAAAPAPVERATEGAADASVSSMATHHMNEWHDHSGVRWLAPMLAVLAVTIIGILLMIVYPYVSGA